MDQFDVLIAGAGPAGSATAIALARFAPTLRVCIADVAADDALRVGETLPPRIKPILEHLGVWEAFASDRHRPSYRTVSAWGGPALLANEFLFEADQVGWRLDRARFDAMLLGRAREHARHIAARVATTVYDDGWRARLDDGTEIAARFLVDATGRSAAIARAHGTQFETLDRLVGIVALFGNAPDDGAGLLVETFADGWWYTAALPGDRRIVACMTDADLVRDLGVARTDGFLHALGATRHVASTVMEARPPDAPALRPAGSRHMLRAPELPLLCVGDAAACFDPVSGQGLFKALRSAIFASYAVGDFLLRRDASGLARYRRLVADEFAAYRATLRDYYAQERRFGERPFWRRRAAIAAAELSAAPA